MSGLERFAYPVAKIQNLDSPVSAALEAELRAGEAVRQMIFAPRQDRLAGRDGWWRGLGRWLAVQQTPAHVLALTDERLLVATIPESPRPPHVTATPLAALLWIELGTILLYSWVAWSWVQAGSVHHGRVYFNSVRHDLFSQMVAAIRRSLILQAGRPAPAGKSRADLLEDLPYKFKNLIPLRLLLPGERVVAVVFHPALWTRRWWGFRRKRAPATAVVLTADYLLTAQDDLTNDDTAYGLIARYCLRDRLRQATLEHKGDDLWLNLTVSVEGTEETFSLLHATETEDALRSLLAQL